MPRNDSKNLPSDDDPLMSYMTREQAAAALAVTARTLSRWEIHGEGPPITHVGNRPLYRKDGLRQWLLTRENKGPQGRRLRGRR